MAKEIIPFLLKTIIALCAFTTSILVLEQTKNMVVSCGWAKNNSKVDHSGPIFERRLVLCLDLRFSPRMIETQIEAYSTVVKPLSHFALNDLTNERTLFGTHKRSEKVKNEE